MDKYPGGRQKYHDGIVGLPEAINAMHDDFVNESDLCNYIEQNIVEFCADCLGVEYGSHKREFKITGRVRFNKAKRIDFLIVSKDGKRIGVECKRPTHAGAELSAAVGQVLSYICLFESEDIHLSQIVIVSTKIHWVIPETIRRFNLPIGFIAFDKDKFIELKWR